MYENLNPAVIKSILSTMPKKELVRHIAYIRSQVQALPFGNRRSMFLRLHHFAGQLL